MSYPFNYLTNSLRFPQGNGQVERMVQTIKRLLKHSVDLHLAVLSYRATPMPWCGLSPSELCMGRRIRTTIPLVMKQLIPSWSYLPEFKKDNWKFKEKQKEDFDCDTEPKSNLKSQMDQKLWLLQTNRMYQAEFYNQHVLQGHTL